MGKIIAGFVDTDKRWENFSESPKGVEQITLWQNDKKFVQILLRATTDIEKIQVQATSDALDIQVYTLESTLAFLGHAGWYARNPKGIIPEGNREMVEDILYPYSPFSMQKEGHKCIFLEISSKNETLSETVEIEVNGDKESVFLELNTVVLNKKMPSADKYSFNVEYWQHPYNVAEYYGVDAWGAEHLKILKDSQLFYQKLGGNSAIVSMVEEAWGGQTFSKNEIRYPSMIKWKKTQEGFAWDYSALDAWVGLNIGLGIKTFKCYSPIPWGSKIRYFDEKSGKSKVKKVPQLAIKKYSKFWTPFYQDFIRHLDKNDWFEYFHLGIDERSNLFNVIEFVKSFKNKNGKSLKISASFNNFKGNKKCFDLLDYASVGLSEVVKDKDDFTVACKERSAVGKLTSIYTATEDYPNSFALSLPIESYWSVVFAKACGAQGFLRWAYDAWVENPLKDTTHWSFQAGDCFLIYPSNREGTERKPLWSYRLLKLDEGVRDVVKLGIALGGDEEKIQNFLSEMRADYTYKTVYNKNWGVAIRPAHWADEQAERELTAETKAIKAKIDKLCNS